MQVIRRRLRGKEGSERVRELHVILTDLPDYKNGPYADIRKWVVGEIESTQSRARVMQRDSIAVRREGAAQIALVGPPNSGKSSLLNALSDVQIKIGNYAFTTLRPVPALVRVGGVLVQFVEIPGLIEGAAEDRGGGRALLSVLRNADAVVYCQECNCPLDGLSIVRCEVFQAGIDLPSLIAATKFDDARAGDLSRIQRAFPDEEVVPVSILDDAGLERLKDAAWQLTGLIRVRLRRAGQVHSEPMAMPAGATVVEVARKVHGDLAESFQAARVWGASARFEGQRVGRDHQVLEGDIVEIIT
jgi:small GTP-binding protein